MTNPQKRAQQRADELVGTTGSLTDDEQHDFAFSQALDELAYECVTCGWWHEAGDGQHDAGGGWECDDCHGGREDDN